jgi:hypothetical protein
VSTLKYILQGRRDLFKGLWIDESDYDWTPYPVVRLEMDLVVGNDVAAMNQKLSYKLKNLAKNEGVILDNEDSSIMLESLIKLYFEKFNQKVAVLIDEYDAPIMKYINDSAKADKFREYLKDFYGVLKTNDEMIGHIFITGVSRFTKTSIFSELSNLRDITLESEYSSICGLTRTDLEDLLVDFGGSTLKALIERKRIPHGSTINDLRYLIDQWYDGYSWDGETRVYNPWSVLNLFAEAKFLHCYQTGTPEFLKELVSHDKIHFDLSIKMPTITESDNVIDDFSSLDPAVILFQTGYLTIGETLPTFGDTDTYRLTLPNLEVKMVFVPLLLSVDLPKKPLTAKLRADETRECLLAMNAEGFERAFQLFLEQHEFNDNKQSERLYHSLFAMAMSIAGQPLIPHEHTSHGILDIRLRGSDGDEFIIEVKVLNESGKTKTAGQDSSEISAKTVREGLGKMPGTRYGNLPVTPKEKASLRKRMTTLAERTLNQIGENYADKFVGCGARLIKVALVIARRTYVLVKFDVVDDQGA